MMKILIFLKFANNFNIKLFGLHGFNISQTVKSLTGHTVSYYFIQTTPNLGVEEISFF